MVTLLLLQLIAAGGVTLIALTKGLEKALPFATFMIVLAPTDAYIDVGAFGLTTQRLLIVLMTGLYLLQGGSKKEGNSPTPLVILMVIHVGWCIVSTANSVVPLASFKKMLSIIFEYYLLYSIYYRTVSKKETIHKIMMAMVLAIMTCTIFGTLEAYRGWSVMSLFPSVIHRFGGGGGGIMVSAERGVRVFATFPHAILYGAGIVMAIGLALYLINVYPKRQWLLWAGLMLMFMNLYKTVSRGPWLSAIVTCVILFLFANTPIRKRILLIGALSVATFIIRPGVYQFVKNIYNSSLDPNTSAGSSYEYRSALLEVVTRALNQDPSRALWGFGLESFFELHLEGELVGKPYTFLSADSAWVELMAETGYIGFVLIVLLLLKPAFVAGMQYLRFPAPDKYLSLTLFVSVAIYYLGMVTVAMYSWGQNGYMLWILIAMIFAIPACRRAEIQQERLEAEQAEWEEEETLEDEPVPNRLPSRVY